MKKVLALAVTLMLTLTVVFGSANSVLAQEKTRAQDDFYLSINGEWLKDTKIPDGEAAWGTGEAVNKNVSDNLRAIVEEYSTKKDLKENSNEKKLVDMYNSFLDYSSRNRDGVKPIKPYLNEIEKISNAKDIINFIKNGNKNFFTCEVGGDLKDSNMNILYIGAGSLGLPQKSFYFEKDANTKKIQDAYKNYLKKLFILKGDSEATAKTKVNSVYEYEKNIASSMLSQEEARNIEKLYNVYTIDELNKLCPSVNMKEVLKALGLEKANKIVVVQPEYLKKLDAVLKTANISTLKNYLEARLLSSSAGLLDTNFEKAQFEYSKVFTGVNQIKPAKETAFDVVNGSLSEILGQVYVQKYFSKEAKQDVESMVKALLNAYEKRISNLDWMSDATKAKAIKKLKTMDIKIGYPDEWEDYSQITIKTYENGGSLVENLKNIGKHFQKKQLSKLNKPVNKKEWGMSPQTINAYYNPSVNEIVFPAAILQAPFYSYGASKAQNLGGIGTVIGHEISHAFDDQGSRFDENGNMVNWWTDADFAKYTERTKKLEEDYSKLEVLPNEFINGKLTLGENIADLGGISAALDVLKTTENPNYDEFFKAYATIWRGKMTDEIQKMLIKMDPHSPKEYRVNQVLKNIEEFYKTYNVTEKDKMYTKPENRRKVW